MTPAYSLPQKVVESLADIDAEPQLWRKKPVVVRAVELVERVRIKTREGELTGEPGDFLIEGIEHEIYPCGKEIFFKTYEAGVVTEQVAEELKRQEFHHGQLQQVLNNINALMRCRHDEKLHVFRKIGENPEDEVHEYNREVVEKMLSLLDKLWTFNITNYGDLYLTSGGRVVLDRGYGEYFNEFDEKICSLAGLSQGFSPGEFRKLLEQAVERRAKRQGV